MVAESLKGDCWIGQKDQVQLALEQILTVSFHKKDWGGEVNDLSTANVIINRSRRAAAFLSKGNWHRKKR